MKHLKYLKYMLATCMYMQYPDEALATYETFRTYT
jgi:hypothetical protein